MTNECETKGDSHSAQIRHSLEWFDSKSTCAATNADKKTVETTDNVYGHGNKQTHLIGLAVFSFRSKVENEVPSTVSVIKDTVHVS